MLREIGSVENIPTFLEKVKEKTCKLMGFGHRVYKNVDPRAKQMRILCNDVLDTLGDRCDPTLRPLLDVAVALQEAALKDEYFVKRKLFPNVDFYSGLTLSAMGIPTSMFTVIFAIGRSAGWISQWKESREAIDRRISRPRQLYTGLEEREFTSMEERGHSVIEDESKHFLTDALKRQSRASNYEGVIHTTRSVKSKDDLDVSLWGY